MTSREEMLTKYAFSDALAAAVYRKDFTETGERFFLRMQRSRERAIIRAAEKIEEALSKFTEE